MQFIKLILIFGNLLIGLSSAFALNLSWLEAEDISLKNSFEIKARQAQIGLSIEEKKSLISGWLPQIQIGRQLTDNFDQGTRTWQGVNSIDVSMPLPNPFVWQMTDDIHKLLIEESELEKKKTESSLKHKVRLSYFTVKLWEQKLDNAGTVLQLTQRLADSARDRYNKGFIQTTDYERINLQFLSQKGKQEAIESQLLKEKQKLLIMLGLPQEMELRLMSSLNISTEKFKQIDILSGKLANVSLDSRRLQIEADRKKMQLDFLSYKYLPDLALGLSSRWQGDEKQTFIISLGLNWTIYDRSIRYFDHKKYLHQYEIARNESYASDRTEKIRRTEIFSELKRFISMYERQRTIVNKWSELVTSTERRFQTGVIRSNEVMEDIKSYIVELDQLQDIGFNIIEQLSLIAFEIGDDSVFGEYVIN